MTGSIDWVLYRGPLLPHPPPSCCVDEGCGQFFTIGCASALEKYERKQLEIIGPIGLAFGLFQVSNQKKNFFLAKHTKKT